MGYRCQIDGCDREVQIRTKIKNRESEYYGKSACNICASKHNVQKEKKKYIIPKSKTKTVNERKEVRKDYSGFFQKHVQLIKEGDYCCEECGDQLFGDVSEVCHILAKSTSPELATNDDNILMLCGRFSNNGCHARFDSSFEKRENMKAFKKALIQYEKIKPEIIKITKEVLHYDDSLI